MFRHKLFAVSLAALSATSALAAIDKISEVQVTADLAAVQNEKAAAYWGNVATDLQAAIVARLVDRIDEEGPAISVDISEVELANAFERAYDIANATLVGDVLVRHDNTTAQDQTYQLKVSLEGGDILAADGTVIAFSTIDTPEVYKTLIDRFADSVVERLAE